jgi:hypothetical protein
MDQVERQWRDLSHCCADHHHDLHSDVQHAILPDDDQQHRRHGESRQRVESQRSNCFDQCQAG